MSNRAIRLGGTVHFIALEVLEFGTLAGQSQGDLRLSVSVGTGDFCGHYAGVWISKGDWANFITSLKQLERERAGQASVFSMSPDEFELNLQSVGHRGGRVVVHGHLSRYHFGHPSGNTTQSRVQYCFDLDPSMLRQVVDSFVALGDPAV